MRKGVTIIIGLLLIAIGVYIAYDLINMQKKQRPKKERSAPTVFIEKVSNKMVPVSVVESGRLMAKNRIEVFAEVQGIMESTGKEFKAGVSYRKGEVFVKIRDTDYYANLQAQKSNLQNLITSILPDLRLDYPEAYKKWDTYLRNFDMESPVAPLPEPSSDKERFFVTGRNIYTTYYNTKNMEIIHSKYNLRAPFSGVLTEALVNPGSLVRQGQKLGEFIDPTIYEMEVAVNKTIIPSLRVGKSVTVRDPENHLQTWKGHIIRINGSVDRTTQTVKVFIKLSDRELKEGMYLEAIMEGNEINDAIEIDRSLLVEESGVYVVEDSTLKLVQVQPVFFNQTTVIVKGLENGQSLISRIVPGAYNGMDVKIFSDQSIN